MLTVVWDLCNGPVCCHNFATRPSYRQALASQSKLSKKAAEKLSDEIDMSVLGYSSLGQISFALS